MKHRIERRLRGSVGIRAALLWFCASMAAARCATYQERTREFQQDYARGNFAQAYEHVSGPQRRARKNRLLRNLELGSVSHQLGEYERSNEELEAAYRLSLTLRAGVGKTTLSLLTNPEALPYRGEDYELVLLHYFKALNYLSLGKQEAALVEARRLDIRLREINGGYRAHKNRYGRDAFALMLSGWLYDAAGEYNDAFIAYRNAYDAYREVYAVHFGIEPPEQLKRDLLRAAARSGLDEERVYYADRFGISERVKTSSPTVQPAPGSTPSSSPGAGAGPDGEVILLWHTGLGPVKDEWSLNFLVVRGQGGLVTFVNREQGLSFPFAVGSGSEGAGLEDLRAVRVAFPRFLTRSPRFTSATATVGGREQRLETAQDINAIALATLHDRMVRELSVALLRVAVKQATEAVVRRQNENLAALLSLTNAVTERADTRNWQTVPGRVAFARLALPAGEHTIRLRIHGRAVGEAATVRLPVTVQAGRTTFVYHHTLASYPPRSVERPVEVRQARAR
jgi:hypothetical protein